MCVIFGLLVLAVVYSYFCYPLILLLLKSRSTEYEAIDTDAYTVSIIVTAHNEEAKIEEKIQNTLAIDFPKDRLDIIVASDCSADKTDDIVKSFAAEGVRLVRTSERKGKENAQLNAIKEAKGDIIVFTDVSTKIPADCIGLLIKYFENPQIGAVSSEDRFLSNDGKVIGEGLYVKYEMWLRRQESRVNSVVGLSGSFFAARKQACERWDIHAQSDFNTALNCASLGLVAVTAPDVLGYYKDVNNPAKEYSRKFRTIIRGITSLLRSPQVINPFKYGLFAFQVFSHKVMRWLVPWFLLALLLVTVYLLPRHWFYGLALAGQAGFYSLAMLGYLSETARKNPLIKIVYFFVQVNLAIAHASIAYLLGKRMTTWSPSKR